MKFNLKKRKGITLITLVITIVILLILAGVALNMIMGENGIFRKANSAREKTNYNTAYEELKLIILETQAEKQGEATLVDIVEKLEKDTENEYIINTTSKVSRLSNQGDIILADIENGTIVNKLESKEEIYVIYKGFEFTVKSDLRIIKDGNQSGNIEGGEDSPVEKYIITYDANGGTGGPTDINEYETGSTVSIDFTTIPTREGFTFLGWANTSDATAANYVNGENTELTIGSSDVTLYAIWKFNVMDYSKWKKSGQQNCTVTVSSENSILKIYTYASSSAYSWGWTWFRVDLSQFNYCDISYYGTSSNDINVFTGSDENASWPENYKGTLVLDGEVHSTTINISGDNGKMIGFYGCGWPSATLYIKSMKLY